MSRLYVRAARLLDGVEQPLDDALRLELGASLASPARSMSGTFAVKEAPGQLGAVRVYGDGRLLFEGRVDRQQMTLSAQGFLLELEARSRGALLLDNEAQPCVLTNLQLGAFFNRFIAPYGFILYNPNPSFTLSMYRVRKDLSEWEALVGFTRRAWGITPYVEGDQVMVDRPRSGSILRLSNTGGGIPFSRLEDAYIPYKMVSRVVLRDAMGEYATAVQNSDAPYHGVRRKRYVIPANEFVDVPALDANQRIRRSMLESRQTVATLPGLVDCALGQEVQILDAACTLHNLMVGERRFRQEADGVSTRLGLTSSVYY